MRERTPLTFAQFLFGVVPPLTVMLMVMAGVSLKRALFAGLTLLVGGGVLVVVRTTRAMRARDELAHLATPEVGDPGLVAEAAMHATAPAFSRDHFVARVHHLVGRFAPDAPLDALHPFLSDGLYQRLRTQERLGDQPREAFSGSQVKAALITRHAVTSAYDQLTVRVTLARAAQEQTFHLSFLRRRGARTQHAGLTENRCPQCGAPLALTATQRCAHCEAIVNSGTHDWVLCELSPGVHHLGRAQGVLDPEGLLLRDTHLAIEELEDRAALAFWRWVEARGTGETARVPRVATPGFLELLPLTPELTGRVQAGQFELRALRESPEHDEASVVVRWSMGDVEDRASLQWVLELRRPRGQVSNAAIGLSTLRCARCLAASADAEEPCCAFCGAPFTDAWCVHQLTPFAQWSEHVGALRAQLAGDWSRVATPAQREQALRLLVSLARAEGAVSDAERAFIEQAGQRWALEPALVKQCLDAPTEPLRTDFPRHLRVSLTRELVELAFIEGPAQSRNRSRLEALAQSLGTELELSSALTQKYKALRHRG